jgi:hypothetical protein
LFPLGLDLQPTQVDFFSFAVILEVADPPRGALFVDLGHGTGRAVLAAALLCGHQLGECRGVEVLPALVHASWAAQAKYDALLNAKPALYDAVSGSSRMQPGRRAAVVQLQGDLLSELPQQAPEQAPLRAAVLPPTPFAEAAAAACTAGAVTAAAGTAGATVAAAAATGAQVATEAAHWPAAGAARLRGTRRDPRLWVDGAWTDGDLIFANSTCFAQDLMARVGQKCAALKPGSVVVTLTQSLECCDHLTLFDTRLLSMSWGPATAFFHRRCPVEELTLPEAAEAVSEASATSGGAGNGVS